MSIVRLTILGTLGSKTELKTFKQRQQYNNNNSTPPVFINFNVAVNYNTKNDQGEWQDDTHWYRITAFGYEADKIATKCNIGDMIYLDCNLKERKWKDPHTHKELNNLEITASYVKVIKRSTKHRSTAPHHADAPEADLAHDEEELEFGDDDDVLPFSA